MRIALSASILLLLTVPGLGAAVTYQGTIGDLPVVAEITEPDDGVVAGRYFYRSIGGDIPLDAATVDGKSFTLAEEALCQPGQCIPGGADGDTVEHPPVAAIWSLTLSDDGQHLTGTWQAAGKSKSLPIVLDRIGERTLPMDNVISPYFIHDSASMAAYDPSRTFSAEALPYDFAKLDAKLTEGPVQTMEDGSSFRYVTDPRTKFEFPRVVALADGGDVTAINAALALEHGRMNISALDCLSAGYAGFGWNEEMSEAPVNSLGGYDEEVVRVSYLSSTVMSWNQSGSLFCMGAYPDNRTTSFNFDVGKGQPLDLNKILAGWVPRSYGDNDTVPDPADVAANPGQYHFVPDAALRDWILTHLDPGTGDDPQFDEECGYDELIADNTAVRFEAGDQILFTLEGLPHVIFACTKDLVQVPLIDIPQLLLPEAVNYFPAIATN